MLFITTNKSRESSGMKMYGVLSEYGGLRMKKNGKRYVRRKIQERNNWGNDIQKMNPELVKTSSDIQDEEFLKESAERLIRILGEPTRTYKDRIFRMLLSDRKTALEVYNAMNDSNYDNPDELVFSTLKNAVYMGMKNDVSFITPYFSHLYFPHLRNQIPVKSRLNLCYNSRVHLPLQMIRSCHLYSPYKTDLQARCRG